MSGRTCGREAGAGRFAKKTVLVGVTGCIAAYKACEIVRELQKEGARTKVVMTEHACEFVAPTTFRALTREPVAVGLFDDPSDPIHHVSLARECDAFLIAPCTANVAAKLAHGLCDDLLTTTALAVTAPLLVAPAMNVHMYENPATQANLAALRARGVRVIEAGEGYLACGEEGRGRLADAADILDALAEALSVPAHGTCDEGRDCSSLRVLVTAGPTVEPIDPVRFISNRSSGKMGYALAEAALARGAEVRLVTGPVAIDPPAGAETVRVSTAREMLAAAEEAFAFCDIALFSAAVADMRPACPSERKLKKGLDGAMLGAIELVENPDVLATCAAARRPGQVVVGFAAETERVVEHAREKLLAKGADLVVANDVSGGAVFGADESRVTIVSRDGVQELPLQTKRAVADAVLDAALALRA